MTPKYPFMTYVKAAFQDWYNYSGLILCAGMAAIFHNPGPVMFGAGIELAYLYFMATNPRFIRSVDAKLEDEKLLRIDVLRDKLWPHIDRQLQEKYKELEHMTQRMRSEYEMLPGRADSMQEDNYRKIIMLLASYLKIARAVTRYRGYLESVNQDQIKKDIERLKKQCEGITDERILGVRRKNIDVLQKRLEKIEKAGTNWSYLMAQMEAIEDTMRLVVDQAITLSDPKGTGVQIDNLLTTLNDTELLSSEMEYYNELEQGMADDVIDLPTEKQ